MRPRFAEFVVRRARSKAKSSRFGLVDVILAFWRSTGGPGKRKAYLPSRKVKRKGGKIGKAIGHITEIRAVT